MNETTPDLSLKPLVTQDVKVAAAALACHGTLVSTAPVGTFLEFTITELPADWFKNYMGHKLLVDPSLMNAWQEHLQTAIRRAFPRRQKE